MATFTFQIITNKQHYIKIHYKNSEVLTSHDHRTITSTQTNNCMFHAAKTYIVLYRFIYTNFVKYFIFFPSNVLWEDNNLTDVLTSPGLPLGVDGSHFENQRFRTPGDRNRQINQLSSILWLPSLCFVTLTIYLLNLASN